MAVTLVGSNMTSGLFSLPNYDSTNTIPADVEPGDLLVLLVIGRDAFDVSAYDTFPPAGWTVRDTATTDPADAQPANNIATVLTKVAEEGDAGSSVTVSYDGGTVYINIIAAFRGANTDELVFTGWDKVSTGTATSRYNDTTVGVTAGHLAVQMLVATGTPTVGVPDDDGRVTTYASGLLHRANQGGYVAGGMFASLEAPDDLASVRGTANATALFFDLWQAVITVPAAVVVPPEPGEPDGPTVQSPLDRYRSSISADAGSLLATTRAVPFDTSHAIAFSPAAELEQETLYPFHEATSVQSGTPDVLFYPRARQGISGPIEYDGVTLLTLMERVYPRQILTRTTTAGLGALARARDIIDYVFQQWAAEYTWFTYKPVPDLRLRSVNVTGDWDSVLSLRLTLLQDEVIRVRQSSTSPRSMRAMLEGLLSPFPGTQFYMDSDGDLVIRPVYGPDADATPYKTLDEGDVVTISIGEASVDQIVNRATVGFQRYTETDEVSVLEPAFLQVASNFMRDTGSLPGPPVSDYLITPPTDRLDLSTDDADFGGWRSIPLREGVILGDDPIAFEDTSGLLITAAVNTYDSAGTLDEAWTSPGDLTVEVFNTVPLDGSTVLAFGVRRGASYGGNSYYGRWNARWNATENAVQVQWAGGGLEVNTAFGAASLRAAQMSVRINGVARAWAEGATITATFGVVDDGDFVPGPGGTNALAASVTAFGVVEERFTIEGYGGLSTSQLERIVEAYVMENLTPRATRELALTWKGAVGVEFDDRGRLVGFPTDGEGFLIGRRYADDFISNAGGVTVTIEETVPGSPGTIDFDTVYLLLDGGELWLNDDATASPPA